MSALHETDWYAWVHEQTTLLETGQFDALDVLPLVEELRVMSNTEPQELYNRLVVLLSHLLKLQVARELLPHAYDRAQRGWQITCRTQRKEIAKVLRRSPSLRPTLPEEVADAYDVARLHATMALQVDERVMPLTCPWDPDAVLQDDFFPEP